MDDSKKSLQKQLNSGVSALVLLALLHSRERPMYGYEIAKELERRNGGSLPMKSGALYPVLRSLEKQGLLASDTQLSDGGRARRYYEVTEAGRETIGAWHTAWQETKLFVDNILENTHDDSSRKRDRSVSKTSRKGARSRAPPR